MIRNTLLAPKTAAACTPDVEPIVWTPAQAARALQVSERTLYTWTRDGLIPAIRVGRTVRYMPGEIRKRLEQLQDNAQ